MTDRRESEAPVTPENWDADFEFEHNNQPGERDGGGERLTFDFNSLAARISHHISGDEDWGDEDEAQKRFSSMAGSSHARNDHFARFSHHQPRFYDWSEPSPSTPTITPNRTESWDDDFEDKSDSPFRKFPLQPLDANRLADKRMDSSNPSPTRESEFWTDSLVHRDEHNVSPTKRLREHAYSDVSDDDEELGFMDRDEDRTITARLRPRATFSHPSPPPPVPSLPTSLLAANAAVHEPFPRSPTISSFSVQIPGQNAAASTSNLALRRTMSGASSTLALLPPSPPIHRERRRLRKKSRPPRLETAVPERHQDVRPQSPSLVIPSTPKILPTPPFNSPDHLATPTSQKLPLMIRIGSVKKWGARKKRDGTTESEILQEADTLAHTAKNGNWFFRNMLESATSTVADSNERRENNANINQEASPGRLGRLGKRRSLAFVNVRKRNQPTKDIDSVSPHVLAKPRRPTSMQSYIKSRDISHSQVLTTVIPSEPQVHAIGSMSVEDLVHSSQRPPSRNMPGGMRKVSLTKARKAHKRTQSSGSTELVDFLPVKFTVSEALRPVTPRIGPERDSEWPTRTPRPSTSSQLSDSIFDPKPIPTTLYGSPPLSEPSVMEGRHALVTSLPIGVASGALAPNMKASPQTASLGRATPPLAASKTGAIPRRNSLSDLKIPARISEAQVGLRRDLRMVKEFAANVEQLKALEATYASLTEKIQALIDVQQQPIPQRPRPRSNTDTTPPKLSSRHLASALDSIQSRYSVTWECAGLLIELGGGTRTPVSSPPVSVSEPVMTSHMAYSEAKKNRERAITLAGEESKFNPVLTAAPLTTNPVNIGRHASTERHPLNRRQLHLLEEILKNDDCPLADPGPILEDSAPNKEWKWGDAMNSTVTLPSDSSQGIKKKRSHRLRMIGLRSMLRSLKRNHSGEPMPISALDNPIGCQHQDSGYVPTQRRAKKTADAQPPLRMQTPSPTNRDTVKQPRRPSLASIFRLGQRYKSSSVTSSLDNVQSITTQSSGRDSCSITDEGDWDRMESSSDLGAVGTNPSETVRRLFAKPSPAHLAIPLGSRNLSKSQSSLVTQSKRPCAAEPGMNVDGGSDTDKDGVQASRETALRDSIRPTAQPQPTREFTSTNPKLAMTPENIKPLLENSKEVISRLERCIAEMHVLLDADAFMP